MSTEKAYLCDEYKLYFKIEEDVDVLHNEVELYNTPFVGNNVFCHEEIVDGYRALAYSIPAMISMNQFMAKKIHRDELIDIMFSIADQLMYLKANGMSLGRVILNRGYMYLNLEDMSVQLIYLPMDKPMEKCDMEKFVRDFIANVTFADKKASDCAYELIKYFDHNKIFYLSEFYKLMVDMKKNDVANKNEVQEPVTPQPAAVKAPEEQPVFEEHQPGMTGTLSSGFKLAKEVKDYSASDIGFDVDDSDAESTTVLTNIKKTVSGPVIIRTRTGEQIRIDKPIFCIGKSAQGVDYQVTDNNSVSRRHAYIINVNGVYYLRDNKSTNHTYLGGKIINSGTDMMLIDGSRFKLANEEFTFHEK